MATTRDFARRHYQPYEDAKADIDFSQTIYLVTSSPNPNKRSHDQIMNYITDIQRVFRHMHRCCSVYLISPELNQNGNIHYHGWYQIKDHIKYNKSFLPKLKKLGHISIKKVVKPKTDWDYYCQKDYKLMKELMQPYPVPFSHINYRNILTMMAIICNDGELHPDLEPKRKTILDFISK